VFTVIAAFGLWYTELARAKRLHPRELDDDMVA
jgi:hypothetical protein